MEMLPFFNYQDVTFYCDDRSYFHEGPAPGSTHPVGFISTVPKSNTWGTHYFVSMMEALVQRDAIMRPYKHFYNLSEKEQLMVGVGHMLYPGYRDILGEEWLAKRYPSIPGIESLNEAADHCGVFGDNRHYGDVPNVLIYRNPFDQIISYAKPYWRDETLPDNLKFLEDGNGEYIDTRSLSAFIRGGGIQSYAFFIKTYIEAQKLYPDNVLMLPYEDMMKDRPGFFNKVMKHIVRVEETDITEHAVNFSAIATDIGNMKKFEEKRGFGLSSFRGRETPEVNYAKVVHVSGTKTGKWREIIEDDDITFIRKTLEEFEIDEDMFVLDL